MGGVFFRVRCAVFLMWFRSPLPNYQIVDLESFLFLLFDSWIVNVQMVECFFKRQRWAERCANMRLPLLQPVHGQFRRNQVGAARLLLDLVFDRVPLRSCHV